MPNGTVIHNIELTPGRGGQIVRSAGASAQLMAKEGEYTLLRLPSGEMRRVLSRVPGDGRAGRQRREQPDQARQGGPHRGTAAAGRRCAASVMNPVDHPHGGGEGKAPIGMPSPKSPWGKPTLGKRTRGQEAVGQAHRAAEEGVSHVTID